MKSLHLVNNLVRDLYRDSVLMAEFQRDPAQVLDRYPFTEAQREGLLDGSFPALSAVGMHPLVQIVYSMAIDPSVSQQITAHEYLVRD
jgi:2'-aminobiphenyl-2,3-diol 1,2-dioxygenase small subunit